jgi:hypothetical protein
MKKLQEFILSGGYPIQESEDEDEDTQEKEMKEWSSGVGGPAGGGENEDMEPAASDTIVEKKEKKWIQKAAKKMKKKGTEGSETKAAHAAGETPMKYAHQHYHDKGKTGQKARFAVNAQKRKKESDENKDQQEWENMSNDSSFYKEYPTKADYDKKNPKKDKKQESTLEEQDLERTAKLTLRQRDTTLWGMSKNEARAILKKAGYSDSGIKNFEMYKENKINKVNEEGFEFSGMRQEFPGNEEDRSDSGNIYDGSANGSDGNNLGDLRQRFDPNTTMEPLYGINKPYDRGGNMDSEYGQTSPETLNASGPEGYHNSIPPYHNRSAAGFMEDINNLGNSANENEDYERIDGSQAGKKGWESSLNCEPSNQKQHSGSHFGDKNESAQDIDPNSAERQKKMPNKYHTVETKKSSKKNEKPKSQEDEEDETYSEIRKSGKDKYGMIPTDESKINVRKLIDRALEKGYSAKQIKEMLDNLKKNFKKN